MSDEDREKYLIVATLADIGNSVIVMREIQRRREAQLMASEYYHLLNVMNHYGIKENPLYDRGHGDTTSVVPYRVVRVTIGDKK